MQPVQRNEPSMLEKMLDIVVMLLDAVLDFPNLVVMLWHATFTLPVIMVVLYMRLISTSMLSVFYKISPEYLHPQVIGAIWIMDNLIGMHIIATFYAYLRFPAILADGVNLYNSSLFCLLIQSVGFRLKWPREASTYWDAISLPCMENLLTADCQGGVQFVIFIRATIDALRIIDWLVLPIVILPLNEVMLYVDQITIIYFLILFIRVGYHYYYFANNGANQ